MLQISKCWNRALILLGTQMIAKGLHFPNVTLVGVLNSDISLQLPDFRAAETTFQLITQVAGRAGRGQNPGEVIVQSYMPDNEVIRYAAQQEYHQFFSSEIAIRKMFDFPPHKSIIKVQVSGPSQKITESWIVAFQMRMKE